uniref:Uncharacterized protein n=1 Tax=viral metagenome TaxID=1070528 RepID=A0A6C0E4B9_9ZZZZ
MQERSFTLVAALRGGKSLNVVGGRFISETPSSAAKKAFSKVYNELDIIGRITLTIQIRETTRGAQGNLYKYKVSKINKPTEVQVGDSTIIYKYITKVKSIKS